MLLVHFQEHLPPSIYILPLISDLTGGVLPSPPLLYFILGEFFFKTYLTAKSYYNYTIMITIYNYTHGIKWDYPFYTMGIIVLKYIISHKPAIPLEK